MLNKHFHISFKLYDVKYQIDDKMDWSLCVLCQHDSDNLVVPSANSNTAVCGYSQLAKNISAFVDEGLPLPNKITSTLSDLEGDTNVADNLKANKAQWHKGCQAELAPSKLKRALESNAKKKRKKELSNSGDVPSKRTRSSLDASTLLQSCLCLFCNEPGEFRAEYEKKKHPNAQRRMSKVRTDNLDDFIRKAANEMGDVLLLAKLSEGNLFARDACYHLQCMMGFRNRYRAFLASQDKESTTMKDHENSALAETMMHIEERLSKSTNTGIAASIKLSDIRKFYDTSLSRLVGTETSVNVTRLKDKILDMDSCLQAVPDKKEVYISYKEDMVAALKYASWSEADYVMSVCNLARKIKAELADKKQAFNGHFGEKCQEQSVSPTFLSLMYMLTGIDDTCHCDADSSKFPAALVLAQLLAFNSAERRSATDDYRYRADRETPVAIYIAFLIHSKTRSKDLVDRLHSLGICISYDRLSTLSTQLGNSVIKQFENDELICPITLRKNLFTTHAVDNIDHNPSSRTAQDSWHGTAISASQHLKGKDDGCVRPALDFQNEKIKSKKLKQLPAEYTCVSPYVLKNKDVVMPGRNGARKEVVYCFLFFSLKLYHILHNTYTYIDMNFLFISGQSDGPQLILLLLMNHG